MSTDMEHNYNLAVDDEEFSEIIDLIEEDEEYWDEDDYFDLPEDDGEGFFDPMEKELP